MKTHKLIQKLTKLIMILMCSLLLLNAVVPVSLCLPDNQVNQYIADKEKKLEQEIISNLDEAQKSKINETSLQEYKDEIYSPSVEDKPSAMVNETGYKEWYQKMLDNYLKYYQPFVETGGENGGKYEEYDASNQSYDAKIAQTQKKKYYDDKIDAYKKYVEEKKKKELEQTEEGKKMTEEEKQQKIENEAQEALGQVEGPYTELTEEEKQRAEELLKTERHPWWETIFKDIFEKIFRGLVDFVCSMGDAVINTIQGLMLPGSPKAVAYRRNTGQLKKILDERGDDAFIYCFVEKSGDNYIGVRESKVPVPLIYYSPAAIFSNKIPALDINFINSKNQVKNPFVVDDDGNISQERMEETKILLKSTESVQDLTQRQNDEIDQQIQELADNPTGGNSAAILQEIVSKWYVALRDIAIAGLLIVLVYIGIRILLSASAEEKSRYKNMIQAWVMGIVLIVTIHYIMAILLALVNYLIGFIGTHISINGDMLMNKVRTQVSHYSRTEEFSKQLGFGVIYLVLIWYVIIFTWQYMKRVIFTAFLTIIAPLVGLTYPLDKIKDNKSQAFNMWIREYIY